MQTHIVVIHYNTHIMQILQPCMHILATGTHMYVQIQLYRHMYTLIHTLIHYARVHTHTHYAHTQYTHNTHTLRTHTIHTHYAHTHTIHTHTHTMHTYTRAAHTHTCTPHTYMQLSHTNEINWYSKFPDMSCDSYKSIKYCEEKQTYLNV